MMRKCHLNTCPVGVATQDPVLRKQVHGPAGARRQLLLLRRRRSARDHGAARHPQVRRPDRPRRTARHEEGHRALEGEGPRFLEGLLSGAEATAEVATTPRRDAGSRPRQGARSRADREVAARRIEKGEHVSFIQPVRNVNRTVGAMLSGLIARKYGHDGPAGRHDPHPVEGHGGPELRRVPREGHHARPRRRRQRLRRQGPVGRPHHHPPDQRLPRQVARKTSSAATR